MPDALGRLHVQIPDVERILFDELAAALHVFAHQRGEDLLAFAQILQAHLQQRALLGIHGGFPQLLGVHFAQPFVALHADVALAFVLDVVQQVAPVRLRFAMVVLHHRERRLIVLARSASPERATGGTRAAQKFDVDQRARRWWDRG